MEKPIVIIVKSRGGGYAKAMKELEDKIKKLDSEINFDDEREKRREKLKEFIVFAKAINQAVTKVEFHENINDLSGVKIDFVVVNELDKVFLDCAESIKKTSNLIEELGLSKTYAPIHGFKTEKYPYEDCSTLSTKEFGMKKRGVKNFNKRRK
jgi:hypothetical protein